MDTDWKSFLGNYLATIGTHRVDFLNDQLHNWLKEYFKYLNEFNGVWVKSRIQNSLGDETFLSVNEIANKQIDSAGMAPFIIGCIFNYEGNLYMRYSAQFSWEKSREFMFSAKKGEEKPGYTFKDEIFEEPAKVEKEYVLQLINQRLANYMDNLK